MRWKPFHCLVGFENGNSQESDAGICSEKSSKTPDSLQMIAPGTQSCSSSDLLNGFPGFGPNFQPFWSRKHGSYSKLRKKRKFLRCCWSSAPWKEMDSPSVCYRSTAFLGILHPRITIFLGFPLKGNAILVLFSRWSKSTFRDPEFSQWFILGSLWTHWVPLWSHWGSPWAHWGSPWPQRGSRWGRRGSPWAHWGPLWAHWGPLRKHWGTIWKHWCPLGIHWDTNLRFYNTTKYYIYNRIVWLHSLTSSSIHS